MCVCVGVGGCWVGVEGVVEEIFTIPKWNLIGVGV